MSIEAINYVKMLKVGKLPAKYVLKSLAEYADERFSCFPAVGLLAAEMEIEKRAVQKHLAYLRELGLISDRENFRSNGSQTSNRYQLHGPWDDYAGTGVPFPQIVTPKQARAALWAQAPAEGEFREGTAAAAALKGDKEKAERLRLAAEAAARADAAKAAQSERGKKGAAGMLRNRNSTGPGAEASSGDVSPGEEGVSHKTPLPLSLETPPGVPQETLLEPSVLTVSGNCPSGVARVDAVGHLQVVDVRACEGDSVASGKSSEIDGSGSRTSAGGAFQDSGTRAKRKLTDEQQQARDAILPLLPGDFRQALGDVIPQNVCEDLVAGLAAGHPRERTPRELVEYRLLPRWNGYWANLFYAGELTKPRPGATVPRQPFGPLSAMVKDMAECGHPRCEDRRDIDRGEPCISCEMRKVNKKADQARTRQEEREGADREQRRRDEQAAASAPGSVPAPRSEWWDCVNEGCDASGKGEPPADGICRNCREKAALAAEIAAQRAAHASQDAAEHGQYATTAPF